MRKYSFLKTRWLLLVGGFDFIGDLFFATRNRQKKLAQSLNKIKKILLIRLDHIGDGILLTPLVKELRRSFPEAKIHAVFSEEITEVFKESKDLDKIWTLKRHWFSRRRPCLFSREIFNLLRELRQEKFDVALDPRGDLRTIFFLGVAQAQYRIGYGSSGGGFLLNQELFEKAGEHEIDRNLRLVEVLGIHSYCREASLSPQSAGQLDGLPKGNYAVIHVGAGTQAKLWPTERWGKVVRFLSGKDLVVVIVGKGKIDEEFGLKFGDESKVFNMTGRLSLSQVWSVIRSAKLFIGCDSGLAHGAGALGIKTLVLESGSNESERWGVRGAKVQVLRYPVFCSPCHLTVCRFPTHECMMNITEAQVEDAANALLKS